MLRQIEPAGDPLLRFLILEVIIKLDNVPNDTISYVFQAGGKAGSS